MTLTLPNGTFQTFGPFNYPNPSATAFVGSLNYVTNSANLVGGTWTARPHNQPNVSSGTWVIVDASGKPILTGSWSARKADKSWVGTWQARVSSSSGGVYSGSWTAESPVASASQFVGLFEYALTNTTRGTWRIGSQSGQWAIRASPRAR